jgi:NAD(P)-dependent dehydrogenase (short-subunit alcohol dehydrogenase family)
MLLAGKIAVVTGAAGNLGSATARELAAEGAKVVASDLPGEGLERVVAEINAAGGEAVAHPADLSSEADIAALIARAVAAYGGLDLLASVAALMGGIEHDRDLLAMDSAYWDKAMAVNLRGAMLACKHAIPQMLERGGGAIVTFGSTAGQMGDVGLFAYSASKAALASLARSIATSYGKQGIRANCVCPGSVWPEAWRSGMTPAFLTMAQNTRLTPRLGVPEDIGRMVAFLLSDKASYVTGQTIMVDGGGTVHQPWVRMD